MTVRVIKNGYELKRYESTSIQHFSITSPSIILQSKILEICEFAVFTGQHFHNGKTIVLNSTNIEYDFHGIFRFCLCNQWTNIQKMESFAARKKNPRTIKKGEGYTYRHFPNKSIPSQDLLFEGSFSNSFPNWGSFWHHLPCLHEWNQK